jgi:hypothetical protein
VHSSKILSEHGTGAFAAGKKGKGKKAAANKFFKRSDANDQCVVCQYLVQRIRSEMLMNGIGGGVPFGETPPMVGLPRAAAGDPSNPALFFTPPPPAGGKKGAAGGEEAEGNFLELSTDAVAARPAAKPLAGTKQGRRDFRLFLRKIQPAQIRYATLVDGPMKAAKRAQQRYENQQMYTVVYQVLESICAKHVPQAFYDYCTPVVKGYQKVAEGLKTKDRPDSICVYIGACTEKSYVQNMPHSVPVLPKKGAGRQRR